MLALLPLSALQLRSCRLAAHSTHHPTHPVTMTKIYCSAGSPTLQNIEGQGWIQVGLTSGLGCMGETDEWGYFVKLADKVGGWVAG